MQRILLVEDSPETQILVTLSLNRFYDLVYATSFAEAKSLIGQGLYDLILLDVTLPDGDGYQLCNLLQNTSETHNVPVIFLTARDNLTNKLMGFFLGADDYIVKPFNPVELRARVDAKIRSVSHKRVPDEIIERGSIQIDVFSQRAYLTKNNKKMNLELTPIEYKLLLTFANHTDQVMTRDRLLTAIWGDDVYVSDRSIDTHVSKLRKKLAPDADYIQFVYGMGYVFSVNAQTNAPLARAVSYT